MTIDNFFFFFFYVMCFKFYTDSLIVSIFVEKLFQFERFVLEPCTCNAFAPCV